MSFASDAPRRDGTDPCARSVDGAYSASTSGPGARGPASSIPPGRCSAWPSHPIQIWRPDSRLRRAVVGRHLARVCGRRCAAAVSEAGRGPASRGIGFDATCSLVVLDARRRPVDRGPARQRRAERHRLDGPPGRWRRRSASTPTDHPVLRYVGGVISPEMQTPKLLWLKEHLPESWRACGALSRPSGLSRPIAPPATTRARSARRCASGPTSGTRGGSRGGTRRIFRQDRPRRSRRRGLRAHRPPRAPDGRAGRAASRATAAAELGLAPGTSVGVSIIDAHAGGVGLLGTRRPARSRRSARHAPRPHRRHLELPHGGLAASRASSPAIWGPYFSAMIPGCGSPRAASRRPARSSTTSSTRHAAAASSTRGRTRRHDDLRAAERSGSTRLERRSAPSRRALTRDLHVLPYFHGNRSPRADATCAASSAASGSATRPTTWPFIYLATIQAIAHGTRHIIDDDEREGLPDRHDRRLRRRHEEPGLPPRARRRSPAAASSCRASPRRCCSARRCSAPWPRVPTLRSRTRWPP